MTQLMQTILTSGIVGAVLGFIEFLIQRSDGSKQELSDIHKELTEIKEDAGKTKAENARNRILRFADECRRGEKHSEEFFIQIKDDIKDYLEYCKEHPDFKNSRTTESIDVINMAYEHCRRTGDFL